jgi:cobalt/nickel transport system ATP-binding protein
VTSQSNLPTIQRSPAANVAIAVHDLHVRYPDSPPVLQGLELEIREGERVGTIGPNGAGKTTLFLSVCGVIEPNRGAIELFGQPVEVGAFRPELGLVFQNPSDQLFCATVWDDVAFGAQNMGLSAAEVEQRVLRALEVTGVTELAQRPPHHLSGGQKRMVAIAGIIAMQPRVVIYDEPSANLDLRARRRLIDFLQQSQETMVISSHDLELLIEVCERVVLIDQGHVVADGSPHEIMGDQELMEAHGLEKPHSLIPHRNSHHSA